MSKATDKLTGDQLSKQLNALVDTAVADGVAFQHIVCQLEVTKHMLVGDFILRDRVTSSAIQGALNQTEKKN